MIRRSARTIRFAAALALLAAQYLVLRSTREPSLVLVLGSPVAMFIVFTMVVSVTRRPTARDDERT